MDFLTPLTGDGPPLSEDVKITLFRTYIPRVTPAHAERYILFIQTHAPRSSVRAHRRVRATPTSCVSGPTGQSGVNAIATLSKVLHSTYGLWEMIFFSPVQEEL